MSPKSHRHDCFLVGWNGGRGQNRQGVVVGSVHIFNLNFLPSHCLCFFLLIQKEELRHPCTYARNKRSMMQMSYDSVFFVCEKDPALVATLPPDGPSPIPVQYPAPLDDDVDGHEDE